jgi:hypothetical protein
MKQRLRRAVHIGIFHTLASVQSAVRFAHAYQPKGYRCDQ